MNGRARAVADVGAVLGILAILVAICFVIAAVESLRRAFAAGLLRARRASVLESRRRARSPQRHLPFVWLSGRDGFTHVADQKNLDARALPALAKSAELIEGEARFV